MTSSNDHTSITILGSGTCVPSLTRSSCSFLLETSGTMLLFDVGPGTMRRLMEAGTTIYDISFIFLSHFHPDHTGELVPFLFSTKYANGTRRKQPLTIVAGKGFVDFYEGLKRVYGRWIVPQPDMLDIIELDNNAFDSREFGNFKIESIPVIHNDESIAYKLISHGERSIVYSGDTEFCDSLIDLAKDADLLICESAYPDALNSEGHLTPSQAGEIAHRAGVNRLLLTHFYPECETVDMVKECRKTYNGHLELAEDLMRIEL